MPVLVSVLSYLPTVLFWLLVVLLLMSELVGFFAASVRHLFRVYVVVVIMMLATWYASETANHVNLTVPDFTPWTHFMSVFETARAPL